MTWKWTYFVGAVLLAGYYLLRAGAPFPAVLAGVAGVALFQFRSARRAARH